MMWAYFVKDVKENARWGLLAALLLSGLLAYLLYNGPRTNGSYQPLSLVGDTYLTGTKIGFAVVGLGLGLALVLSDRRRGHWGFAVHRPVPRWKLFAAKVLAGVALYTPAALIAVATAALLASLPRVVKAPFATEMLLPTVYYALAGLMWLSAGMLVGLRQARWIGSRTFPAIGVALVASVVDEWAIHFYEAALADLAVLLVMLAAGAAAFAHNGDDAQQPRPARPFKAMAVGVGVLAILMLLGTIVSSIGLMFMFVRPDLINGNRYILDERGRPYLELRTTESTARFDVKGDRINSADDAWLSVHAAAFIYLSGTDRNEQTPPRSWRRYFESFLRPEAYLEIKSSDDNDARWYYVHAQRTIEGHSGLSGERIGSIGLSGFRGAAEPAEPFPPDVQIDSSYLAGRSLLILTGDRAVLAEFGTRNVRSIFTAPDHARVLSTELVVPAGVRQMSNARSLDDLGQQVWAVAMTPGRFHLVPVSGTTSGETNAEVRAVSVPIDPLPWDASLMISMDRYGQLFALTVAPLNPTLIPTLITLYDGREISRISLPPVPAVATGGHLAELATAVVSPPALALTQARRDSAEYFREVRPPPYLWPAVLLTTLTGVAGVLAIVRRAGLGRVTAVIWSLLTVVFGPAAPLMLLCLSPRPARERCSACGKPRPVDRDACPHCAAGWPTRADPATAVFDDPTRSAA
ncbi:MAG TPA: hypothetical protein VF595_02400 [Tepidisphaeraceae bacterium]|jgi:hypothetical protein